jgi:hypothetical protein
MTSGNNSTLIEVIRDIIFMSNSVPWVVEIPLA